MKRIILAIALINVSYVLSYDLRIKNKTTSNIRAFITYSSSGVCNDDEVSVKANSSAKITTGICCPNSFYVDGTSGPLKGKVKKISTGLCHHTFIITQEGNDFKIVDDKW